jgi:Flp pilus assembly protein TadB
MDFVTMPVALFLSAGALALFSFLAVATWSDNRRKEREAFYRSETLKKIAEMTTDGAVNVLREQDRLARRRQRESCRLAGLVTLASGIGLAVFLRGLVPERPVYLLGLISVLIGFAFLAYAQWMAPRE